MRIEEFINKLKTTPKSLEFSETMAVIEANYEFTPTAFKNGELKPLDKIIGVLDNESNDLIDVIGWELDEVVKLIRGPKNTDVTLQILPTGSNPDGNPYLLYTFDEFQSTLMWHTSHPIFNFSNQRPANLIFSAARIKMCAYKSQNVGTCLHDKTTI
mgnify:CR=1 FL=1